MKDQTISDKKPSESHLHRFKNACFEINKPKLRGFFHAAAFVCTAVIFVLFIVSSIAFKFDLGIFIYMISQLLQFGVSATYHIPDWSPKIKTVWRYLDHSCIFVLISGTQTSVLLNALPSEKLSSAFGMLKVSWALSIIGIFRLVLIRRMYDIFDLFCYIGHGMLVLPFYKILSCFTGFELSMIVLGGVFYIIGGIVYGLEKPNPFPKMFGYHEIFHILTLLANACFGVVISKDYVKSLFLPK